MPIPGLSRNKVFGQCLCNGLEHGLPLISRSFAHDTLVRLRGRVKWADEAGVYRERAAAMAAEAERSGYRGQTASATSML